MRLVHLADLHLGYRQYHRVTPTGINQREADVAHAFRRAIDQVIELRPDVLVIAGDVFHTVRPMNPAIVDAFKQFARLRLALPDTTVAMVAGNHDKPRTTESVCILRLFRELGFYVAVDDEPQRITIPERDLSILAAPYTRMPAPRYAPEPSARYNVLMVHRLLEGMVPQAALDDRAEASIPHSAIRYEEWSYVAFGHYHVKREIAPNAFYAGSLEYTSTNPWGELYEERVTGLPGKGFLEYDLDTRTAKFHHVASERRHIDLAAVSARGLSAPELDAAIAARVDGCAGGIDEQVVRLVLRDVPRHIARELDHRALRDYRRRALHFHLDTRRPEIIRTASSGSPGRRPTLTETVEAYLKHRRLEGDLDRSALVSLGLQYLSEADAAEPPAPVGIV